MNDDDVAAELPKPTAILPWEAQIGYVVAGVAAAGGVIVALAGHNALAAGLTLGAAVVLALAVHHGQRVIAALVGLPSLLLARYLPIELVVMGYVLFLMFRTSNAQAKLRRSLPRLSAAERRAAAEARVAEKRAKRRGQNPPAASKAPAASRRYTPPKAKAHRPSTPRPGREAEG